MSLRRWHSSVRATSRPDTSPNSLRAVADLVATEAPERIRRFAELLRAGQLSVTSPAAALQDRLGLSTARIADYQRALVALASLGLEEPHTALIIEAALSAAIRVRADIPDIEVARTGPSSRGFDARTTGDVSRAVIDGSRSALLLVGYSVTVDPERTGLAARTVGAIYEAASRGVAVTAVLHGDPNNRIALMQSWPQYVRQPSLFTWPTNPFDEMTKLHAKVLVADAADALVTSANLTYHGMEANIELGLRVTGSPAGLVDQHFRDLIRAAELVPWTG
jgi:hypothetical protein